jgi:predicted ATPase
MGLETAESAMPDTPSERVEKEISWAVRHYIEAVARQAPLIVVIDDIQWAEPPVLAMIEALAERVADVRMVIVCVARPEFLESHPAWGAGKSNATTITLDPLNPAETTTLLARLLEIDALPDALRQQIIERSAGTPLFCEEFIHMLIDEGRLVREGDSWKSSDSSMQIEVPQTISAVLAARLDGLPEAEKHVLQAASVVGERFELRQLQDLVGEDLEAVLESLRRKGLVAGSRSGRRRPVHRDPGPPRGARVHAVYGACPRGRAALRAGTPCCAVVACVCGSSPAAARHPKPRGRA